MAKYKCNSCGATYSDTQADGTRYFHACGPEITARAVVNDKGDTTKPQVEAERANGRNENVHPDLVMLEGRMRRRVLVPGETAVHVLVDPESLIISEGKGRTLVE